MSVLKLKFAAATLVTALLSASPVHAGKGSEKTAGPTPGGHEICARAARIAEARSRVPTHLLVAISLKETGRWDKSHKASFTWPWTVTAEGKGRYLASKAAAVAEVKALKARGVKNIDVGCMQVNLHYHPHAFSSIEDALNPVSNARYSAHFLRQLKEDHGTWPLAVAHYHSNDPKRNVAYRDTVYDLWSSKKNGVQTAVRATRRANAGADRAAQLAAYSERRAQFRRMIAENRARATREKKERRAAFEKRKAEILAEWDEMKRQRELKSKSSDRGADRS